MRFTHPLPMSVNVQDRVFHGIPGVPDSAIVHPNLPLSVPLATVWLQNSSGTVLRKTKSLPVLLIVVWYTKPIGVHQRIDTMNRIAAKVDLPLVQFEDGFVLTIVKVADDDYRIGSCERTIVAGVGLLPPVNRGVRADYTGSLLQWAQFPENLSGRSRQSVISFVSRELGKRPV